MPCVLRSGSLAIHSAVALGEVLPGALAQAGLPKDCVVVIDSTDRSVTDELFLLRDLVDVLIPRGGAGLYSGTAWSIRSFRSSKRAREIAISTSTNLPILPRRIRSC